MWAQLYVCDYRYAYCYIVQKWHEIKVAKMYWLTYMYLHKHQYLSLGRPSVIDCINGTIWILHWILIFLRESGAHTHVRALVDAYKWTVCRCNGRFSQWVCLSGPKYDVRMRGFFWLVTDEYAASEAGCTTRLMKYRRFSPEVVYSLYK